MTDQERMIIMEARRKLAKAMTADGNSGEVYRQIEEAETMLWELCFPRAAALCAAEALRRADGPSLPKTGRSPGGSGNLTGGPGKP